MVQGIVGHGKVKLEKQDVIKWYTEKWADINIYINNY